ncbi:MAG: hypothetical protein ABL921_05625 [Pirellula sp.]
MSIRSIRNVGLAAVATLACLGYSNIASAQYGYHGGSVHHHNQYRCSPHVGIPVYGYVPAYRPIVVVPSYNRGYSSYYGSYPSSGVRQTWGGYGMGSFPIGGSYGGGAFPRGGSYGGGSGISLYIGR